MHFIFHWYLLDTLLWGFAVSNCAVSNVCYSGTRLWPRQRFRKGKSERQILMTINPCIPVKNVLGWSAFVSCEGELLLLCDTAFSVIFCLVRGVRKFDSRLVTNWTPNKWPLVYSNRHTRFWRDLHFFFWQALPRDKGPNSLCRGQCFTPEQWSVASGFCVVMQCCLGPRSLFGVTVHLNDQRTVRAMWLSNFIVFNLGQFK